MTTTSQYVTARYRLIDKIGEGGMGVVHRAYDRLLGENVAIKKVNASPADLSFSTTGNSAVLALAHEFRILASLHHPNIVSVKNYGFDEAQHPFYAMELLEDALPITKFGSNLSVKAKIELAIELFQALAYLHRRSIIHRDLKPENILVTPDGVVRVMDFGIARSVQSFDADTNFMAGTPAYMAPEQFHNKPYSVASDLYSAGTILYEVLVGEHPFGLANFTTLLMGIMNDAPALEEVPIELRPLLARLLEKEPIARYKTASEVLDALNAYLDRPVRRESLEMLNSFLNASAFVGRQREFELLKTALTEAVAGNSNILLIGGESGVGKSRIVEELRTHALVDGVLVLRGQAIAEGSLSFNVWINAVRTLLLDTAVSDLEAGILKSLVPDISDLLGRPIDDAPHMTGRGAHNRLTLTIVELFKRQQRAVLLILEDLQWTKESLLPLKQILRVIDQLPNLLVVGTYRDDERPDLVESLPGAVSISLSRFDDSAIAALTEGMVGSTSDQSHLVDFLKRETEGNAFFMVETMRVLAEEAGSLDDVLHATLPRSVFAGGVEQILKRRLNRIPAEQQDLLKQAAIGGRALDLDVLRRIASENDIATLLSVGENFRIFEVDEDQWRFSHDKLREKLLSDLTPDETRRFNKAIAEAIEQVYPGDKSYVERLMKHWQAAGDIQRELDNLIPYVATIGSDRGEYGKALSLCDRGLSLLADDDLRRIDLLTTRSNTQYRLGMREKAQEQIETALALLDALNAPPETVAKVNRMAGFLALGRRDAATAEVYLQKALAIFQDLGIEKGIAICLENLSGVASDRGDNARSSAYLDQVLAIRRRMNRPDELAITLVNVAIREARSGQFLQARTYLEEALELSYETGNLQTVAGSLNNLSALSYDLGEYDVARDYAVRSIKLNREIGHAMQLTSSILNYGRCAVAVGEYEVAKSLYDEALRDASRVGDNYHIALANLYIAQMHQDFFDWTTAQRAIEQAVTTFEAMDYKPGISEARLVRAEILIGRGEYDEASSILSDILEEFGASEDRLLVARTLCAMAELMLSRQGANAVNQLYEALEQCLTQNQLLVKLKVLIICSRYLHAASKPAQAIGVLQAIEHHHALTAALHQQIDNLRAVLNLPQSTGMQHTDTEDKQIDLNEIIQRQLDDIRSSM